jgi:hypothetical protein
LRLRAYEVRSAVIDSLSARRAAAQWHPQNVAVLKFITPAATGVRPVRMLSRNFGCVFVRGVLELTEPTRSSCLNFSRHPLAEICWLDLHAEVLNDRHMRVHLWVSNHLHSLAILPINSLEGRFESHPGHQLIPPHLT